MSARVEARAREVDIAVLKVSNPDRAQSILSLGSAYEVCVGQEVVVIGSAVRLLQNTVTRGIVSAVRPAGRATLVQTDAAANPGNSGALLIDRTGRVVGITTLGFTDRQGLNLAVAIDHPQALLEGTLVVSATAPSSSATSGLRGLSPPQPSQADQAREQGSKAYEQELAELARRADVLDS